MKRVTIVITSILLVGLFVYSAFAEVTDAERKRRSRLERDGDMSKMFSRNNKSNKSSKNDADKPGANPADTVEDYDDIDTPKVASEDPNEILARVRKFDGLEKELGELDRGIKQEQSQWKKGSLDERLTLGKTVQKEVIAELMLIRKCALAEGATKTVAALDHIILTRKNHFDTLNEEMKEAKRNSMRDRRGTRNIRGSRNIRSRNIRDSRYNRQTPSSRYRNDSDQDREDYRRSPQDSYRR